MKLHLSYTEPKITLVDPVQQHQEKDITYDTVLLTGALIAMFHDGSITVMGKDGKPIFDMTVQYYR